MQLRPSALVAALTALLASCSVGRPVAIERRVADLPNGNRIVVQEVLSTTGQLEVGAIVTVRGTYRLASGDHSTLYCGTTTIANATYPDPDGPTNHSIVARGEGTFELQHRIPAAGELHVSMYEVPEGGSIGRCVVGEVGNPVASSGGSASR